MNVTSVACAIVLIASTVAGLKLQLTNNMRRIYTDSGTGANWTWQSLNPTFRRIITSSVILLREITTWNPMVSL